jgi:hypothetical protein
VKAFLFALVASLGLALAGCGGQGPPPGGPALVAYAQQAQQEAADAQVAGQPKPARAAASRAQAALTVAQQSVATNTDDAELQQTLTTVKAAARAADDSAGLAEEEKAYADLIGSFKAKAYRMGRTVALRAAFTSFSLLADQVGAKGYDSMKPEARNLADLALQIAGDPRLADGTPDWPAVSKKMLGYAAQPPPETSFILTCALFLSGRYDLALIEADGLTLPADASASDREVCLLARVFILHCNGFRRMASQQVRSTLDDPEQRKQWDDPEVQATFCLIRAFFALQDKDYRQADLELVQVMKFCPNHPVAVYLTGEVQVGEGQFEKAQESIDTVIQNLPPDADPWLLEHLRDRARYLRDKQGDAEPLFTDPQFLARFGLHCVWQSAKKSEPARKLQEQLESAREFGTQFLKVLPGSGGAAEEKP